MDQDILRRSERLREKQGIEMATENNTQKNPVKTPSSLRSARTHNSRSSVASLKRLAEARAARELAELDKQRAERMRQIEEERQAAERNLIEARLAEETARLDATVNDDDYDASTNTQSVVQHWVDNNIAGNVNAIDNQVSTTNDNGNDLTNLTRAITDAIKMTSAPANVASGDKMLGRLSARDLPLFSGDPLDWLRFKHAFEMTTRVGQYSDEENVARLQRCLQGEAWEAVAARLITVTSSNDIIKTLELRFGRPELVLNRLVNDIKKFPKLTGSRSELVLLATKVSNCVAAIRATNVNCLYNSDLVTEIVNKFTENLVYRWIDYIHDKDAHHPRLSALSDYLMREAELVCKAGVVELPQKSTSKQFQFSAKRSVLTTINDSEDDITTNIVSAQCHKQEIHCLYCDKDGHTLARCKMFSEENVSKRWTWVCDKKLCFKCLSPAHRRERCRSRKQCKVCNRGHHILLHRYDWVKDDDKKNDEKKSESVRETTANVWGNAAKCTRVFLKVLPVTIQGPIGSFDTYALLDEGSTVSLVDNSIVDKVGVDGPPVELNLQGAVGGKNKISSRIVSLTLRTSYGVHTLDKVRTINDLSLPIQKLDVHTLKQYSHLQDIPMDIYDGQPTVLIGQDNWHLIVTREIRQGRKNEPVASRTMLGWVLHGFVSSITRDIIPEFNYHLHQNNLDEDLHELVKGYFQIDSIGLKQENKDKNRLTADEERALRILDTKSNKLDNCWETGLIWRSDDLKMPDNKMSAMQRLKIIEKMMDKDASFAADYSKQVHSMLERCYAEEVKGTISGERVWYLPHFGVRNPNKPGKLRLVFDAKAETKGISLNTELLPGPDLLNSLVGVLMRFRERAVAVTGDIREMFLRVKIIKEDQYSQMFLWRDLDRDKPPRMYRMTSMTFGAKCSPCTATYILRRNADTFAQTHPRAVNAIKERHYVDDYVDSVDTEDEMKQLIEDVCMIHRSGGFEIRGFVSNKPSCLPDESQNETVNLLQNDTVQRTLGMIWRPKADALGFDLSLKKVNPKVANGTKKPTKRDILRVTMSIFDPLGLLCPFLIRGKILLQEVWRSGVQWDEEVGDGFAKTWFDWLRNLKACQQFSVSRCYNFSKLDTFQLHVFVDASEQAYAAVVYLRRDNGEISFVIGKCRVAPLKSTTVPRLELQAALMGARLGTMVEKEHDLQINRRYFWTDSRVVWHWIQSNEHKKNSFIDNRLSEIRDLTSPKEWLWLPGNLNVADEATRAKAHYESNWIVGPKFLHYDKQEWPRILPPVPIEDENVVLITNDRTDFSLPDINRFSKWLRLIRTTANVLVFIERLKSKRHVKLDSSFMKRAEQLWIVQCQHDSFSKDISKLLSNSPLSKDSRLVKLNPFIDNDILRLKGRASAVHDIDQNMLQPVILDGRHHYTKLLVQYYHEKMYHGSTETVVNNLRQKYWIIYLRPTVRSVEHNCQSCKIRKAQPLVPPTGDLPFARLAHHARPFTHCGLDYFGPMVVTIGRRHEKRYGALFTCMTTRAIHIELAGSLTTDSTIMAMRRMMSRRGCPAVMYSDNGTNFHGANTELRKVIREIDSEEISAFLTNRQISWRFNPPLAPHMGGCWERLVRSVKTALKVVLKEQAPSEETLITILAEVEHTINSRPLTHVSVSSDDPEALTPNHFLLGGSSGVPWLGPCDTVSRKSWRTAQRLADLFWQRWVREFLPTLLPRGCRGRNASLKEGSLVIVVDPALPRNVWPKGIVEKLYPGRDGVARVADIRTAHGGIILKRPLTKLVPLLLT